MSASVTDDQIEADARPVVISDESLKSVANLAASLVRGEGYIVELEAKLKEAKERYEVIATQELPAAMGACGMASFRLTDGRQVLIEPVIRGSIRKDKRPEAFSWLRANGHAGLIKREVSVSLSKGQDQLGEEIISRLKSEFGVEVLAEDSVHAGTLSKWAREMIEEGELFPRDLLGVFVGRRATVK